MADQKLKRCYTLTCGASSEISKFVTPFQFRVDKLDIAFNSKNFVKEINSQTDY